MRNCLTFGTCNIRMLAAGATVPVKKPAPGATEIFTTGEYMILMIEEKIVPRDFRTIQTANDKPYRGVNSCGNLAWWRLDT